MDEENKQSRNNQNQVRHLQDKLSPAPRKQAQDQLKAANQKPHH